MRNIIIVILLSLLQTACSVLSLSESVPRAILNHDDPETVYAGVPSMLILLDALLSTDPDDVETLVAAAKLYGAYAAMLPTEDALREQRLVDRAYRYGKRALCEQVSRFCLAIDRPFNQFEAELSQLDDSDDLPVLYTFAATWAGWLQVHADDWKAIAQLPKVKAIMQRVISLDAKYDHGSAYIYLGVLEAQLPPSLGGKPELARAHFEQAITISKGNNLMAKVMYAKHYARLLYDRELHDKLLQEVVSANPVSTDLTLINTLAQRTAEMLLAGSSAYFE